MASKKNSTKADAPLVPKLAPVPLPILDSSTLIKANASKEVAISIKVTDEATSQYAQGFRAACNTRIKELDEQRLTATRPLDATKAIIKSWFDAPINILKDAMTLADNAILGYMAEVKRQADKAQRIADAKVEADRKRDLALAEKAEKRGDTDKAIAFTERAETRVAPVVSSFVSRAPGVSFVKRWDFNITDASKINASYCEPDLVKIRKSVVASGLEAKTLIGEGIHIFEATGLSSKR